MEFLGFPVLSYGLDSFTALVPFSAFTKLPDFVDRVVHEVVLDEDELEVLTSNYGKPVKDRREGITTRSHVADTFGMKCISITVNTKMLRSFASDGNRLNFINRNNVHLIVDHINEVLNSQIDVSNFIEHTKIFDLDITVDCRINDLDYNHLIRSLKSQKPALRTFKKKQKGILGEELLTGCQFVNRADGSISNPFVKIYTKLDELVSRSQEFWLLYLPEFSDPIYRRFEGTIRSRKHYQSITKSENPFNLEECFKMNVPHVLRDLIMKHFPRGFTKPKRGLGKLTPTQRTFAALITQMMSDGHSLANILGLVPDDLTPVAKSRIKKSLRYSFKNDPTINLNNFKFMPNDVFFVDS